MNITNSTGKKLISLALIFALLISLFSVLPLSASASETKVIYVIGSRGVLQEAGVLKCQLTNAESFSELINGNILGTYDAQFYIDKNNDDVYKFEIPANLTGLFVFELLGSELDVIRGMQYNYDQFEEKNAIQFTSSLSEVHPQVFLTYYNAEESLPDATTEPTEPSTTTESVTTEPTEPSTTTEAVTTEPTETPATTEPEATEPGASTKTVYIFGKHGMFQKEDIVGFKVINTSTASDTINDEDIIATYDAPLLFIDKFNQDIFSFEIPLDASGYLWFEGLDAGSNVVFKYFEGNSFLNWIKTDACNAIFFSQISANNVSVESMYYDVDANLPDTTTEPTEAPATAEPVTTEPETTEPTTTPTDHEPTVPGTTVPSEDLLIGDVDGNGILDIKDATLIQKYLVKYKNSNGQPLIDENDSKQFKIADFNGDNKIDVNDVTDIQKRLVKLI